MGAAWFALGLALGVFLAWLASFIFDIAWKLYDDEDEPQYQPIQQAEDVDAFYVPLSDGTVVGTASLGDNVLVEVDYDADGYPVGIEVIGVPTDLWCPCLGDVARADCDDFCAPRRRPDVRRL